MENAKEIERIERQSDGRTKERRKSEMRVKEKRGRQESEERRAKRRGAGRLRWVGEADGLAIEMFQMSLPARARTGPTESERGSNAG